MLKIRENLVLLALFVAELILINLSTRFSNGPSPGHVEM